MPKLILMFKEKILNAFPLIEGGTLTIGRHPDNDIVIENLAVSGHHARIEHRGNEVELTDLGSKNGTQCNGEVVTQCLLNNNDTVIIGKHILQADWTDTMNVDRTAEHQAELDRPLDISRTMILESARYGIAKPGSAASAPSFRPATDCLTFLAGGQGEYALAKKQVSFGRNHDADFIVGGAWALFMGGPSAVIIKQAGDYFLRYTGGWIKPKRNGTSVKGTVKLNHEDIVAIGPIKVQIQLSD